MARRSRTNSSGGVLGWVIFLALAGVLYWSLHRNSPTHPGDATTQVQPGNGDPNLFLGNPSGALADGSNKDNFLMVKAYYALSYNNSKGIPNWVSWRVNQYDLGNAPRKQTFDADLTLPAGFTRIVHKDY